MKPDWKAAPEWSVTMDERRRLVEALRPLAELAPYAVGGKDSDFVTNMRISVAHIRHARDLLVQLGEWPGIAGVDIQKDGLLTDNGSHWP